MCEIAGIDWLDPRLFDCMLKAVEWFENRPSPGLSPGERFLSSCITQPGLWNPEPVLPTAGPNPSTHAAWSALTDAQRHLYEEMAAVLFEHKGSRRE